jgi:pantoate--beta-alanine ligase
MPLQVIRDPQEMRALAEDRRRDGARIALVPTMGYLHEGHLSLLRSGRSRSDLLFMSLFVNPTQFGKGEDLDSYPRDEDGDLAKAESCGVDFVFAPSPESMYPEGFDTSVHAGELARPLCGASRPGHFDGVVTVVSKLFHVTLPHVAVFGEKDYQQLAIIRRLVRDLDFGIEIASEPIVREPDGLAMSSRNAYLSPEAREQARALSQGLLAARTRFDEGLRDAAALVAAADAVVRAAPLARIDYLEIRDAEDLKPIEAVERPALLATAVFFGKTRLIDNTVLMP